MRPGSSSLRAALAFAAAVSCAAQLRAHNLGALQVDLAPGEAGWLKIELSVDAEHLPPGIVPRDAPWRDWGRIAAAKLREGSTFEIDGKPVALEGGSNAREPRNEPDKSPYWHVSLEVRLPAAAKALGYRQSAPIGQYVVRAPAIEGAEAPLHWGDGGGDAIVVPVRLAFATPPPLSKTFVQYLGLGYSHILPQGLDHICFVLGLFLLAARWKPLLVQVTCFTVAHSITLGVAMLGWVSLSPRVVEPLIALSIAYVAFENIATKELKPWRPLLVFAFGLLHGLGFAGVLVELGIPRGQFLPALVAFNLGVEGGQMTVLLAAFLVVGFPFGRKSWYRARVTIPASLAIGVVGLYWTVQRIFFAP